MTEQPEAHLLGGVITYREKNKDYGDSWRKVGEILHLLADGETVELDSVNDHIAYGLYTRRLDKLARGYHGEFLADEMNFESIVDAHTDEMTYSAMQASNYGDRRENRQVGDRDRNNNSPWSRIFRQFTGIPATGRKVLRKFGSGEPRRDSEGEDAGKADSN